MEFIRALHWRKYKTKVKRFQSDIFKNLNGAISIIDKECIDATGEEVCRHLELHYQTVVKGIPFAFWVIRSQDLETHFAAGNFSITREVSESGDECHRNLRGVQDKDSRKFQKLFFREKDAYWCMTDGCFQLNDEVNRRLRNILPLPESV